MVNQGVHCAVGGGQVLEGVVGHDVRVVVQIHASPMEEYSDLPRFPPSGAHDFLVGV